MNKTRHDLIGNNEIELQELTTRVEKAAGTYGTERGAEKNEVWANSRHHQTQTNIIQNRRINKGLEITRDICDHKRNEKNENLHCNVSHGKTCQCLEQQLHPLPCEGQTDW